MIGSSEISRGIHPTVVVTMVTWGAMPVSTGKFPESSEAKSESRVDQERWTIIGTAQAAANREKHRDGLVEFPARAEIEDEVVAAKILIDVAVDLAEQFQPFIDRISCH